MWIALARTVLAFLITSMGGLVSRALVALGIGTATAVGLNALISTALNAALGALNGGGNFAAAMQAMGLLWLVSTLFSAITTRLVLKGLTSDAASFWVLRRGLPGH